MSLKRNWRRTVTPRIPTVNRMETEDANLLYGLTTDQIERLLGVSTVTARRYKRTRKVPEPMRRLLRILIKGDLSAINGAWKGWHLCHDGGLWTDQYARHSFRPADLYALPMLQSMFRNHLEVERAIRAAEEAARPADTARLERVHAELERNREMWEDGQRHVAERQKRRKRPVASIKTYSGPLPSSIKRRTGTA